MAERYLPVVLHESVIWLREAGRQIPKPDRRVLLSPPRLVARFMRFALARHRGRSGGASADDVDARDPALVGLFNRFLDGFARRYFRLRVRSQGEESRCSASVETAALIRGALVTMVR
jgi:hypothetical protein